MVGNHHKGLRALDELLTSTGYLKQTIIFDLFLQIASNERLTDDGIPYLGIFVLA